MPIDKTWLLALLAAAGWSIACSLSSTPWIRGYRNFGLLACYVIGVVMLSVVGWRTALATWAVVGAGSGLLYFLYEAGACIRARREGSRPRARALIDGLLLWPVMLPEAVEYTLAEVGVLKPPPRTAAAGAEASPDEPQD